MEEGFALVVSHRGNSLNADDVPALLGTSVGSGTSASPCLILDKYDDGSTTRRPFLNNIEHKEHESKDSEYTQCIIRYCYMLRENSSWDSNPGPSDF